MKDTKTKKTSYFLTDSFLFRSISLIMVLIHQIRTLTIPSSTIAAFSAPNLVKAKIIIRHKDYDNIYTVCGENDPSLIDCYKVYFSSGRANPAVLSPIPETSPPGAVIDGFAVEQNGFQFIYTAKLVGTELHAYRLKIDDLTYTYDRVFGSSFIFESCLTLSDIKSIKNSSNFIYFVGFNCDNTLESRKIFAGDHTTDTISRITFPLSNPAKLASENVSPRMAILTTSNAVYIHDYSTSTLSTQLDDTRYLEQWKNSKGSIEYTKSDLSIIMGAQSELLSLPGIFSVKIRFIKISDGSLISDFSPLATNHTALLDIKAFPTANFMIISFQGPDGVSNIQGFLEIYSYTDDDGKVDIYNIGGGNVEVIDIEYQNFQLVKFENGYDLLLTERLTDKVTFLHLEIESTDPSPCDFKCNGCRTNVTTECLSCNIPSEYTGSGVCGCPSGQSLLIGTCQDCPFGCSDCGPTPVQCTQCKKEYETIEPGTTCGCPDGSSKLSGGIICTPCGFGCKSCGPTDANICTECSTGYSLGGGDTCSCDDGYSMIGGVGPCVQCNPGCKSCSTGITACDSCMDGFSEGPVSTCLCDPGNSIIGASCLPCNPLCSECSPGDINSCTACSNPQHAQLGTTCGLCDPNCLTCQGISTSCTSCPQNQAINLITSICECDLTTHDITNGECVLKTLEGIFIITLAISNEINGSDSDPQLKIMNKFFNKNEQVIKINFNSQIEKSISQDNYRLQLDKSKSENITLKIISLKVSQDQKTLIIETDISSYSLNKASFYVSAFPEGNPRMASNPEIRYTGFPIKISPINFYQTSIDSFLSSSTTPGSRSMQTLTAVSFVASPTSFISLMKMFQIIDYLDLVNIENPKNLEAFLEVVNGDIMELLPHPYQEEEPKKCFLHPKVQQVGMSCKILNNVGQSSILLLFLFAIKLFYIVVALIAWLIFSLHHQSTPTQSYYIFQKIIIGILSYLKNITSFDKFVGFFLSIQIDVMLSITVSIKSMIENRYLDIQSCLISAFFIILYFFIFVGFWIETLIFLRKNKKIEKINSKKKITIEQKQIEEENKLKNQNKGIIKRKKKKLNIANSERDDNVEIKSKKGNQKQEKKEEEEDETSQSLFSLQEFFSDVKSKNMMSALIIIINLFSDFIIPLLLIVLIDYPLFQVTSCMTILLIKFLFMSFVFPFSSIWENIKEIVCQGIYIFVLILYFVLKLQEGKIIEKERYMFFGISNIVLISLLLLINYVDQFVKAVIALFEMIISLVAKKRLEKVHPNPLELENPKLNSLNNDKTHSSPILGPKRIHRPSKLKHGLPDIRKRRFKHKDKYNFKKALDDRMQQVQKNKVNFLSSKKASKQVNDNDNEN